MRGLLVGGTESGQENGFHVTASHKNNTPSQKHFFQNKPLDLQEMQRFLLKK